MSDFGTNMSASNEHDRADDSDKPRPRLVRPRDSRFIGGVAAGLSNYAGLRPLLIRGLFVFLAFAGGTGIGLYILGWLLIPEEDAEQSVAEDLVERFRGGDRGWIGIVLIVVAALILFDAWSGSRFLWGIGLGVVGYLLYTGRLNLGGDSPDSPPPTGPDGVSPSPTPPERDTPPYPPDPEPPPGEDPAQPVEGDGPASNAGLHPAEVMELEALNGDWWEEEFGLPSSPEPPEPPPPQPRRSSHLGGTTLALTLLITAGFGAMILLGWNPIVPGQLWAVALGVVGLGLLMGAFVGRARWLILVGVLLVPFSLLGPVGGPSFTGDIDRTPTSFGELGSETTWNQSFGEMNIDLTQLPWDGEELAFNLDLGVGDIEIAVPEDVAVVSDLDVGAGLITIDGFDMGGFDIETHRELAGSGGVVNIDARVGAGEISIDRPPISEAPEVPEVPEAPEAPEVESEGSP